MQSRFPEMVLEAMPRYAEKLDEPSTRQVTIGRHSWAWNRLRWLKRRREPSKLHELNRRWKLATGFRARHNA